VGSTRQGTVGLPAIDHAGCRALALRQCRLRRFWKHSHNGSLWECSVTGRRRRRGLCLRALSTRLVSRRLTFPEAPGHRVPSQAQLTTQETSAGTTTLRAQDPFVACVCRSGRHRELRGPLALDGYSRSLFDASQGRSSLRLLLAAHFMACASTLATTEIDVSSRPQSKVEDHEAVVPPHLRKGQVQAAGPTGLQAEDQVVNGEIEEVGAQADAPSSPPLPPPP